jgi:hypothetical protein
VPGTEPPALARLRAWLARLWKRLTLLDPDMTPGARRASVRLAVALVVLFVFTLAVGGANLLFTSGQVRQIRANSASIRAAVAALEATNAKLGQQVRADCRFDAHLAALPLTVSPVTGKPALLSVQIISDVRLAWREHDCPGHLPPPSASFAKWAAYYRLPPG